jgi:hypothetical protein
MTGNQDRAGRAADWVASLQAHLMPLVDACVEVLQGGRLERGDLAGAERQARIVGVIARTARGVAALTPAARSARAPGAGEDEMKHRDDSPENLERMRAELEARLDRLSAVLEAKGLVVEPGCWPVARSAQERVRPA